MTACKQLESQFAPNGQIRVLAKNLDALAFPCEMFSDLYHRIPAWLTREA